jgi:hypothetical protein
VTLTVLPLSGTSNFVDAVAPGWLTSTSAARYVFPEPEQANVFAVCGQSRASMFVVHGAAAGVLTTTVALPI